MNTTETITSKLDWLLSTPCKDLFSPRAANDVRPNVVPKIICADGTTLSVQASRTHYCSPRNCYGPWDEVEVGYPSVAVPEWAQYKDQRANEDTNTVFAYVPVALVREFIAAHGGEKNQL